MTANYQRKTPVKPTLLELQLEAATEGGALFWRKPPMKEILDTERIIDLVERNGQLLLDKSFNETPVHSTLWRHGVRVHSIKDDDGRLAGYRLFKGTPKEKSK